MNLSQPLKPGINYLFFPVLFIILFNTACQTVVELDVPDKPPRLVVNCLFNPDSAFIVNVTKSQYVLDNSPIRRINNARVSLYEDFVWKEDLTWISEGLYQSVYKPSTGRNYQLSVSADGFNPVEASDIVPPQIQIISVDTGYIFRENQQYFEIKIKFRDDALTADYYQLQLYTKNYYPNFDSLGNPYTDTNSYLQPTGFESNDLIFEDRKWFGNSGAVFSDELFASKGEYQLSIYTMAYAAPYDSLSKPYLFDELILSIKSISHEYYKYIISYQKYQETHDNPFAEPVQVYNNIKNGFGIFAAYNPEGYLIKL